MSEASQGERPHAAGIRTRARRGRDRAGFVRGRAVSRSSKRVQRFLHLYPTTVPFVVLLLGLLLGVSVNYSHFVTGSNLSTVLTQVTIIGILGIAQTLVILTAGIDLSVGVIMVISSVVMGRLAVIDGVPIVVAFPLGLAVRRRLRLPQRLARDADEDAAVHRHPRHAQHHRRAQHVLFAERDDSRAGPRNQRAVPAIDGRSVPDRRRAHHPRPASC